jgi:hypothetical protein
MRVLTPMFFALTSTAMILFELYAPAALSFMYFILFALEAQADYLKEGQKSSTTRH